MLTSTYAFMKDSLRQFKRAKPSVPSSIKNTQTQAWASLKVVPRVLCLHTHSTSRISSHALSGSIATPPGRTRNRLWQLLVETLSFTGIYGHLRAFTGIYGDESTSPSNLIMTNVSPCGSCALLNISITSISVLGTNILAIAVPGLVPPH
jgi:hypothetical protein